jgi:hypothetical protein
METAFKDTAYKPETRDYQSEKTIKGTVRRVYNGASQAFSA